MSSAPSPTLPPVSAQKPCPSAGHRRTRLPLLLSAAAATILICLLAAFSTPGESSWLPPCLFHELTGLHCPGCGNTRALHALMHGQLLQSLDCNPLLIPGILTIWALLLKPSLAQNLKFNLAVLIVVIVFFILRNIPCLPFSLLAP